MGKQALGRWRPGTNNANSHQGVSESHMHHEYSYNYVVGQHQLIISRDVTASLLFRP